MALRNVISIYLIKNECLTVILFFIKNFIYDDNLVIAGLKRFYDVAWVWSPEANSSHYVAGLSSMLGNSFFRILNDGRCKPDWYTIGFSGFQLKMTQEVIALVVFAILATVYLKVPFHWKYLISFVFLLSAVYFIFKM